MTTRFAPSPTGYLHLGHALSALTTYRFAQERGGRLLLRIEDIDAERCRPEYEAGIYEDLAWLGIRWEWPVWRQSGRLDQYAEALGRLKDMGVAYPCFCSRKRAVSLAGSFRPGKNDSLYPGVCRQLSPSAAADRIEGGQMPCWRLNADRAASITGPLVWHDRNAGPVLVRPQEFGDVVIARRDVPASYHLSVTVDDHEQAITHVVRGQDLFEATSVHRTLQALLGFGTPEYFHHRLLMDQLTGKKLSKRDGSTSLRSLRARGVRPEELVRLLDG